MDIQNMELHQLMDKDRLLFNLSDTLDMKASVSLILITFLATQTAELFRIEQLPALLHWLQFLSALGLFAATISAIVVLWSRKWSVEKSEKFPEWRAKLQEYFRDQDDADQKIADQYLAGRIEGLKRQIEENRKLDDQKSRALSWSYRFFATALCLNMVTLISLGLF